VVLQTEKRGEEVDNILAAVRNYTASLEVRPSRPRVDEFVPKVDEFEPINDEFVPTVHEFVPKVGKCVLHCVPRGPPITPQS